MPCQLVALQTNDAFHFIINLIVVAFIPPVICRGFRGCGCMCAQFIRLYYHENTLDNIIHFVSECTIEYTSFLSLSYAENKFGYPILMAFGHETPTEWIIENRPPSERLLSAHAHAPAERNEKEPKRIKYAKPEENPFELITGYVHETLKIILVK